MILFIIFFIFVISINIFVICDNKKAWFLKVLLITSMLSMYFCLYDIVQFQVGYPRNSKLPEKFEVHSVSISGQKDIYLTVTDMSDNNSSVLEKLLKDSERKYYRINYTKDLHIQMKDVQNRLKFGLKVVIGKDKEKMGGGDFTEFVTELGYILPPDRPERK